MASSDFSLFAYEEVTEQKKEKSPNALRTISEAAEMLDVPQHVLRFWETKFPQIKPLKRNGGRRFYRPQDIDILKQIKHLLYSQGYTIKGAKKAVDDFIQARGDGVVTSADWLAAIPPASVNDNFIDAPEQVLDVSSDEPDMLAELAQALAEPEAEMVQLVSNVITPDFEVLRALRDELVAMRDELHLHLPSHSVAVQ